MYRFNCVLVSLMLMACAIVVTSAIECYSCNTARSGSCGDKFSKDDNTDKCNTGGVCRTLINKDRAYRSCEPDIGQELRCDGDINSASGETCSCKGDLCNTAVQSVSAGRQIIVGCVAVTAIVGRIFYY